MGSSTLEWVIFDLGAVLIDWNPRYLYRRHTDDESRIETFLKDIATSEWNSQMDAGELFQSAIDQRGRMYPEWRSWLQDWRDHWPTMLNGPIDESVEIFKDVVAAKRSGRLKAVLALSNWEANTFKIAQARFPFLQDFDGKLISGEERLIKPDPRFFQLLVDRHGVVPGRAIFIDDLKKNTSVAEGMGFQTHLFENPRKLRHHLEVLKVIGN
jgi:2-haloacid dehalogenase